MSSKKGKQTKKSQTKSTDGRTPPKKPNIVALYSTARPSVESIKTQKNYDQEPTRFLLARGYQTLELLGEGGFAQ